jgi:hypothetical protein
LACCLLLLFVGRAPISASAEPIQVGTFDFSDDPPAVTIERRNVRSVLGIAVRSAANEDMGRIVDVIVDRAGNVRAAVIDFGGFLGVGSRKIAVDWGAIRFTGLDHVTLDMTRDQVKAAPPYESNDKPIVVLGASPAFNRSQVTTRNPEQ